MSWKHLHYRRHEAKEHPRVCEACYVGGKTTQKLIQGGETCNKCGHHKQTAVREKPFNPWGDWDTP